MDTLTAPVTGITTSLIGEQSMPIVLEPGSAGNSLTALEGWIQSNEGVVKKWMKEYGALLFRGFAINGAADFERVAKLINPDLKNNYLGTSPRNAVTEYVFSASELPDFYPIMQHCEMSFLHNPPANLFFYCNLPTLKDGETPIVDFRKVYQQLNPTIRQEFETKGVRTIRNYNGPNTKSGLVDLWKLKRWDEMFATTDKKKVEENCRENLMQFEWLDGDKLRLINDQEAVITHPETGEKVWFNHTQVFHVAAAAIEYQHIYARQKNNRALFYRIFTSLMTTLKSLTTNPEAQAMHCTFRDGSPIPDSYVKHLEEVIWNNMSFFLWQKGDLLAIDNYSTSHGRMPYTRPREIFVCWSAATLPAGYHYGSSK